MKISATVTSQLNQLETLVQTNDSAKQIPIPPKNTDYGSSINGGELLLLSIATCFCNDLYRESRKRNITITSVEVMATGEFGADGEPGTNFQYKANVTSDATPEEIRQLIEHTDKVAEIHNTLRKGISVNLA